MIKFFVISNRTHVGVLSTLCCIYVHALSFCRYTHTCALTLLWEVKNTKVSGKSSPCAASSTHTVHIGVCLLCISVCDLLPVYFGLCPVLWCVGQRCSRQYVSVYMKQGSDQLHAHGALSCVIFARGRLG